MASNLYIVWNESNCLGIPIIDEQHRGIVSIINSYYSFVHEGRGEKIIVPTLMGLLHFTSVHFLVEEELISAAGYPHMEQHVALHRALMKRTKAIAQEASTNIDTDMKALAFLKEWWLTHINKEDRGYAPYVIEQAAKTGRPGRRA
ncbi:MAG: bacteriohemerythrin [Acidobacteriota bacterium]